jgi:hypothetical protein
VVLWCGGGVWGNLKHQLSFAAPPDDGFYALPHGNVVTSSPPLFASLSSAHPALVLVVLVLTWAWAWSRVPSAEQHSVVGSWCAIFGLFFRLLLLLLLGCSVLFCGFMFPLSGHTRAARRACWCWRCCCCCSRPAAPRRLTDVCKSGRVSGAAVAPPALLSSRLCSALLGVGLRWLGWLDLAPPR